MNLLIIKMAATGQNDLDTFKQPQQPPSQPQPKPEPAPSDPAQDIGETMADASMWIPDLALKGWDYVAGKGTDFVNNTFGTNFENPHAKTWDETKGEDAYRMDAVEARVQQYDPHTPEGRAELEYRARRQGHLPHTQSLMDYGRQHPDSWQQRAADVLVPVENVARRVLGKDAPVNAAIMMTPVGPVKHFGTIGRTATVAGTEAALFAAPGVTAAAGAKINPTISLMAGVHPGQIEEQRMRWTYGNQFTNEQASIPYLGQYTDNQGQVHQFSGAEIKDPSKFAQSLQYFQDYKRYRDAFGIADDQMTDEKNLMGYVMSRLGSGGPGTEIFNTPMFRMLSADNKVEAMNTWLEKRYVRSVDNSNILAHATDGKAAMLSAAIMHDRTGVFTNGFNTFLQASDVPSIIRFLEVNSGGGGGGGGNTEALMNTLQHGMIQTMKTDPTKVKPMLQGVLKLQAVQSMMDSKDPTAPNRGAQMIQNSFKHVLADPELFKDMPDEDKRDIITALAKVNSGNNGQNLLGAQGDALTQAVIDNLQEVGRDLLIRHPEWANELAGAWFDTKNMPGVAEVARNPWVFWTSAGALLFGGLALAGSALDDDEDEEEEDDYEKALRRRMFT